MAANRTHTKNDEIQRNDELDDPGKENISSDRNNFASLNSPVQVFIHTLSLGK